MFSTATNPYDELIVKATDENLASEDWALNMEVCDKVGGEGQNGGILGGSWLRARQAVAALQKRLSHRNPSVQLYALELANTLAQNCDKELLGELSSRNWTSALDRLINDRATAAPVKKKALLFVKAWAKQLEDTGDPNLGLMGELYDQLRAKNFTFDEPEAAPEDAAEARRRQEEEELARVLELSKQDKGGRNAYQPYQPSATAAGGSSSSGTAGPAAGSGSGSSAQPYQSSSSSRSQPQQAYQPPAPVAALEPEPDLPLDINTATRVRALYTFTSAEVGELNFERGDVIKVLDRGFKEWWRGACNGQIGIFPVTYVEAMPEPSPRELQEEAQEEARVFASLGLVDQLLQTLKGIDPSRGDRLDDRPEIEEMYQASVSLQGQINALIKKYSDQKAELEHMNANFVRALRQYEELRNPPPMPAGQAQPYGYSPQPQPQPQADPYAQAYQQQQQQQYPQQAQVQPQHAQPPYAQQPQPQYAQQPQQYTAEPHPHQYATETQSHSQYPSQHPTANPIGNGLPAQPAQAFPQAQPHPGPGANVHSGSGSSAGGGHPDQASFGQPYNYAQRAVSSTSINRVPTAAPGLPPNDLPRQNTEPGVAGLGAGSDPQAEHKAAWDAYYRQQAEQQQQQQQQSYGVGAPPHHQQQGIEVDGTQNVYGQSPYAPQQQGQHAQGVDGVTSGMNRMTVHGA
ncbi:class E vacuolar protein-sorting machinery protein HSE1 [Kwoniella heveanensis CBS 569]|nr:class E vacuolar protein-sorting machinery protein HSE1 [Kwoniella heveanensis CBS 569]